VDVHDLKDEVNSLQSKMSQEKMYSHELMKEVSPERHGGRPDPSALHDERIFNEVSYLRFSG